jgi:hypothetical protein
LPLFPLSDQLAIENIFIKEEENVQANPQLVPIERLTISLRINFIIIFSIIII